MSHCFGRMLLKPPPSVIVYRYIIRNSIILKHTVFLHLKEDLWNIYVEGSIWIMLSPQFQHSRSGRALFYKLRKGSAGKLSMSRYRWCISPSLKWEVMRYEIKLIIEKDWVQKGYRHVKEEDSRTCFLSLIIAFSIGKRAGHHVFTVSLTLTVGCYYCTCGLSRHFFQICFDQAQWNKNGPYNFA